MTRCVILASLSFGNTVYMVAYEFIDDPQLFLMQVIFSAGVKFVGNYVKVVGFEQLDSVF